MYTRQVEKGVGHLDLFDTEAIERVEAELDAFVERRAREAKDAAAVEELWAQSVRQDRQRRREENARAWHDYYASMARVHHGIAAEHAKRADGVLEELAGEGAA